MKKEIITPVDGYEYFFGYYDLQPFSADDRLHLTHRVKFNDRLPVATDLCEIGYINIADKTFRKISDTRAWNFQQGALLNWFKNGESVIFNDYSGGGFVSRVVDLNGNEQTRFSMPLAAINSESTAGLSINFPRIYDFRSGYGYCNAKDAFFDVPAPENDGIFLCDLLSGENKLLVSYAKMKEVFAEPPFTDLKLVVNHITFNPSGTEYVFLLRNFAENGKKWGTVLAVGDLNGNIRRLTKFETNSHYSFKDDKTLMIFSGLPEWGVYFINLQTGERKRLYNPILDRDDIHCNYAPDRKSFIGDGYPEEDLTRTLYRYDFATEKVDKLVRVHSEPVSYVDIRCDLHARFNASGSMISYDTTENKRREIALLTL